MNGFMEYIFLVKPSDGKMVYEHWFKWMVIADIYVI
jgi:hypothetical protein